MTHSSAMLLYPRLCGQGPFADENRVAREATTHDLQYGACPITSSMTHQRPVGLFITGTDTEVGENLYSRRICKEALHTAGLRVGVYKPVASGCRLLGDELVSEDAVALWNAAGRPRATSGALSAAFCSALAPHLAAGKADLEISAENCESGLDYRRAQRRAGGRGGRRPAFAAGGRRVCRQSGSRLWLSSDCRQRQLAGHNPSHAVTLVVAATCGEGLDVAGVILNQVRATRRRQHGLEPGRAAHAALPRFWAWWSGREFLPPDIDWIELASAP